MGDESYFFKDGVMDFERFRNACIRFAKYSNSVRDGYEEDFASFCVIAFLEKGFIGYRSLTGRFWKAEFIGGSKNMEPRDKLKAKAIHGSIEACPRPLVDERTAQMVADFESRCAIPNENAQVVGNLWFAYKAAMAKERLKAKQRRKWAKSQGRAIPFTSVVHMNGALNLASKRLKKAAAK